MAMNFDKQARLLRIVFTITSVGAVLLVARFAKLSPVAVVGLLLVMMLADFVAWRIVMLNQARKRLSQALDSKDPGVMLEALRGVGNSAIANPSVATRLAMAEAQMLLRQARAAEAKERLAALSARGGVAPELAGDVDRLVAKCDEALAAAGEAKN